MKSEATSYYTIGVTGGIGSGKTTVCKIIEGLGYPVFYSDLEAKKVMTENNQVIQGIQALFGKEAYVDGALNRVWVAEKAFNNPELLTSMNNIVHPAVRQAFLDFTVKNKSKKLIFNESAILFETGSYKNFDFNILITAPKEHRIARIIKRDNITAEQVENRMKNQWEDEKKSTLADFVIQNDASKNLETEIALIIDKLLSQL